jgi:tetratricopeptide (TPR) repeat protein
LATAVPSSVEDAATAFDGDARTKSPTEATATGLRLLELCRANKRHDLVERYYPAVSQVAGSARQKGRADLELARSVHQNQRDLNRAREIYQSIIGSHGDDPEAAAGALLQRGQLELFVDRNPDQALRTYVQALKSYPSFSQRSDLYLARIRAAKVARNNSAISLAAQELAEEFPMHRAQIVACNEVADYELKTTGDRERAVAMWKKATTLARDNEAKGLSSRDLSVAMARMRLADEDRTGDYDAAISEYRSILETYPNLSNSAKDWCRTQIGIYQYQMGRPSDAQETLQQLVAERKDNLSKDVQAKVALHLEAIAHPKSRAAMAAAFDRGYRWREVSGMRDQCWRVWSSWLVQAQSPEYEEWVKDPKLSPEVRAELLWRKAIVLWELTPDHTKICPLMDRILTEIKPVGSMRHHALYMKAYHMAHTGAYREAIGIYRSILEENSRSVELVPSIYKELANCAVRLEDPLGVALVAEEFLTLYPYRAENKYLNSLEQLALDSNEEVRITLPGELDKLRAKLQNQQATKKALALADDDTPTSAPQAAQAQPVIQ